MRFHRSRAHIYGLKARPEACESISVPRSTLPAPVTCQQTTPGEAASVHRRQEGPEEPCVARSEQEALNLKIWSQGHAKGCDARRHRETAAALEKWESLESHAWYYLLHPGVGKGAGSTDALGGGGP